MSSTESYRELNLELVEWLARPFCCDRCEMNHEKKARVGEKFPSGDLEPPAHDGCTCCLLPVIPGFND